MTGKAAREYHAAFSVFNDRGADDVIAARLPAHKTSSSI
jgi:hypothetical protein